MKLSRRHFGVVVAAVELASVVGGTVGAGGGEALAVGHDVVMVLVAACVVSICTGDIAVPLTYVLMPRLTADCRLHALRGRREVGSDGTDASFKVTAFEGFVVDPIVNATDLAFNRSEAVVELVDCLVEFRLRHHVILDEIDPLKDVLRVFVHISRSIP